MLQSRMTIIQQLAFSEEKSIQYIADYGATVPLHSLKEIIKILEEK